MTYFLAGPKSASSVTHQQSAEVSSGKFRFFAKHMDTHERYQLAAHMLQQQRFQTPESLVRILQAKLSERVSSYASQQIRTRKLFEAFDVNGDGVLDEAEFRVCLEKINLQFDDIQALALFAFFDVQQVGFIHWSDFANHVMVQNPRGATGVLPKVITTRGATMEDVSMAAAQRSALAMYM
jgi:hypothetical protein